MEYILYLFYIVYLFLFAGSDYEPDDDDILDMENFEELEITEDAMEIEYQEPTSTKQKREDSTPWRLVSDENSMRGIPVWKSNIPESDSVQKPIEYFRKLFGNGMMDVIVHQSNLYSAQSNPGIEFNQIRI